MSRSILKALLESMRSRTESVEKDSQMSEESTGDKDAMGSRGFQSHEPSELIMGGAAI